MRIERIDEIDDPRVQDYRNLRDPDLLVRRGAFIAESRLVVRTLIAESPYRVRSLLLTERALAGVQDLLGRLPAATPVFVVSRRRIAEIAGFHIHQGCLAVGERPPAVPVEALRAAYRQARRWVLLENVTNPDNVGAVMRNALAFGGGPVLLDARCADPLYRKAIRTSMGASLRVPFARVESVTTAIERLSAAGFTVVALTPDPSAEPLAALALRDATEHLVLLFGSEGEGLSDLALGRAAARVRIPMAGEIDSINVGAAAAIVLYALQ
jgi:tRNA G18 (ribose-2'-O)-methylase SpoU